MRPWSIPFYLNGAKLPWFLVFLRLSLLIAPCGTLSRVRRAYARCDLLFIEISLVSSRVSPSASTDGENFASSLVNVLFPFGDSVIVAECGTCSFPSPVVVLGRVELPTSTLSV